MRDRSRLGLVANIPRPDGAQITRFGRWPVDGFGYVVVVQVAHAETIVTGASSGIGAAIARELARRKARVTLVDINGEGLDKVTAEIEAAGGAARAEVVDLSSVDEIEALAGRVRAATGVPHIIVNNAGAGRFRAIDETDPGECAKMMAVPYLAAFELTRVFIAEMIEHGRGRVACMTSLSGYTHIPGANGYRRRSLGDARVREPAARGPPQDRHRRDLDRTIGSRAPYFANNPGSRERIPRAVKLLGGAVAAGLARATADAIEHDRDEVIVPRRAEIFVKLTPAPIFDALVRHTGWRRQV